MKVFCEEQQNVCSQVQMNAVIPFTINGYRVRVAGEDLTPQKRWFKSFIHYKVDFWKVYKLV